jgi:polyhydroxybutyrate depolymerase
VFVRTIVRILLLLIPIGILLLSVGIYFGIGPSFTCIFPSAGPVTTGLSTRRVASNGIERCFLLYVPPGFDPALKVPIVFALHGLAGNPQGLRSMSAWESVADRERFLVVYPHGSWFPLRWNTSPGFMIEHIDDVQFVVDLLDDLAEIVDLDEDRIFISGFSNGAAMTDLVACSLADRIAAVGLVQGKGENDPQECAPTQPVPVIAFFGMEDPLASAKYPLWFFRLMNLSSDPAYREEVPISVWSEGWAKRNGCNPNPQTLPAIGDARGISYMECTDNAEVVIYLIEEGGHAWPGGANLSYFGKSSTSIKASEIMWNFFQLHPRANVDR